MKTVPITEVKLDTSDAVIRDVVAGRLDIALIDPPGRIRTAAASNGLHQLPVAEPDRYPIMSTGHYAIISVAGEQGPYTALNAEVRKPGLVPHVEV
jgi:DNA-binding transcriptional LysR family regulator